MVAVSLALDEAVSERDSLSLIGTAANHSELDACLWPPRRQANRPNQVLVSLRKPLTARH